MPEGRKNQWKGGFKDPERHEDNEEIKIRIHYPNRAIAKLPGEQ